MINIFVNLFLKSMLNNFIYWLTKFTEDLKTPSKSYQGLFTQFKSYP